MGKIYVTILCLSSIICYWNSLNGDMVFDDIPAILNNADLKPSSSLKNLWIHDFWGTPIHLESSHKSYRPLCVLTFRFNYAMSGVEPWGYHFVNIVLHTIVCLLFQRLCETFLKLSKFASFLGALLFAVHPIHTEAVSSIVGRSEILSAIFYSLALINLSRASSRHSKNVTFLKPIIFALLGCLSKEQCFAFFPLAVLYLYLKNQQKYNGTEEWHGISIISFFCGLFLIGRVSIMGGTWPKFSRQDNPLWEVPTSTRVLTNGYISFKSAWQNLYPNELCCDWSSNSLQLVTSIFDYRNTAFIMLILIAVIVIFKGILTRKLLLLIGMIIIPYIPASNWLYPVGFVMAERVMYLPSMGLCALVAEGFEVIIKHPPKTCEKMYKYVTGMFLVALIASHASKTILRNQDWLNESALFESGLKVAPNNTKLLNNYSKVQEKMGNYTEALFYYQKAIMVDETDIRSYINAGNLLQSQGQLLEAENYLKKAVSLVKTKKNTATMAELRAYIYLANVVAFNKSRLAEASSHLNEVIQLRADFSAAYVQKGEILIKMNRSIEAVKMFKSALDLDLLSGKLSNPNFLNNYGALLLEMGQDQEAFQAFSQALTLDPTLQSTHINLALLVQETSSYTTRNAAINKLQELTNQNNLKELNETLYYQLGMLALDRGDKMEAQKYFTKSLEVNPTFRSALYNLALLLFRENRVEEAKPLLKRLIKHYPDHINGIKLSNAIHNNMP